MRRGAVRHPRVRSTRPKCTACQATTTGGVPANCNPWGRLQNVCLRLFAAPGGTWPAARTSGGAAGGPGARAGAPGLWARGLCCSCLHLPATDGSRLGISAYCTTGLKTATEQQASISCRPACRSPAASPSKAMSYGLATNLEVFLVVLSCIVHAAQNGYIHALMCAGGGRGMGLSSMHRAHMHTLRARARTHIYARTMRTSSAA